MSTPRELRLVQRHSGVPFDYKPKSMRKNKKKIRARWILTAITLSLVGGLVAYMPAREVARQAHQPLDTEATDIATPTEPEPTAEIATATESVAEPPEASQPSEETIDFVVRRNDTLEKIFRRLDLKLVDLSTMLALPDARKALSRLRPGDKVTVVHADGAVNALNRRLSDTQMLSITRGDDGFAARVFTTPLETRTVYARGTIESSLFVAARAAGMSPETILRLANDIFGWDIDFALDIRPGDRFNVIYEQRYRDGQFVGDGRILAAEFVNDGETYRAVRYTSEDGNVDDYFTPEGRSMRRQFVRAPLDFTRVSSNFNLRRRHPILNIIRAHQGVDYAAPIGTVIKAAGNGRVGYVGFNGGYGRVVILEHGGGISTLYGHMSRFARGLHD
ncbi:MAG TPA: peptidoglycan DD-metalloendopeptidase family protein, partial [Burkholderiales bacterium]|nr:peptidoglycan DD-metalloendopeptidase family protein [Burkholderiales bacterium]